MNANIYEKCKPARVYLNQVGNKTFVHYKSGSVEVQSDDLKLISVVDEHINKHGLHKAKIKNVNSLLSFIESIPELTSNVIQITPHKPRQSRHNNRYNNTDKFAELENNKSVAEISLETKNQDLSTIKFKQHTIDNAYMLVDSREPLALQTMLYNCQIQSVDTAQLPLGDIVIGFKDESVELIIERKTINDGAYGITNSSHHSHDQIERLYQYVQEKAEQGIHVKVIWIFENQGDRTLYNMLPQARQTDGWVNLSLAISDQYIATSYNLVHTAYLICKFAQGFLERKLTYPVKVNGSRIDTAKPHKLRKVLAGDTADRGISRAQASIAATLSGMPSIPANVAKELALTGKCLREIFSMSHEELQNVKGVGAKLGVAIYSTFNDIY